MRACKRAPARVRAVRSAPARRIPPRAGDRVAMRCSRRCATQVAVVPAPRIQPLRPQLHARVRGRLCRGLLQLQVGRGAGGRRLRRVRGGRGLRCGRGAAVPRIILSRRRHAARARSIRRVPRTRTRHPASAASVWNRSLKSAVAMSQRLAGCLFLELKRCECRNPLCHRPHHGPCLFTGNSRWRRVAVIRTGDAWNCSRVRPRPRKYASLMVPRMDQRRACSRGAACGRTRQGAPEVDNGRARAAARSASGGASELKAAASDKCRTTSRRLDQARAEVTRLRETSTRGSRACSVMGDFKLPRPTGRVDSLGGLDTDSILAQSVRALGLGFWWSYRTARKPSASEIRRAQGLHGPVHFAANFGCASISCSRARRSPRMPDNAGSIASPRGWERPSDHAPVVAHFDGAKYDCPFRESRYNISSPLIPAPDGMASLPMGGSQRQTNTNGRLQDG